MSGKLIVTTIDLPYPPRYGHKVDQYHRWKGFAELGWRLRLICWRSPNDPPYAEADIAALAPVFESIEILPIGHDMRSFARRAVRLPFYPSHVASRIPSATTMHRLEADARAFAPDAIVLDGIYGGVVGRQLARACAVPIILRGHNIEHRYFAQQARLASTQRAKLVTHLARLGLRRWEERITCDADWSFQISADDVNWWRAQGVERVSWAPTVFPGPDHGTLIAPAARAFDVAYIGNMRLPNNLAGLRWFVREVLPELRRLRPGTSLCFAGANPSDKALTLFADAPEVTLVADAPNADEILANGRVLVNPILSGSGVNVKSIDMLRYDAPIVTTPVGVQGFPPSIRGEFAVCDNAASFAAAIVEALRNPVVPAGRAKHRASFGQAGLDQQSAAYARICRQGVPGKETVGSVDSTETVDPSAGRRQQSMSAARRGATSWSQDAQ
jgi:polysaccharide biosynthesis protein PslH